MSFFGARRAAYVGAADPVSGSYFFTVGLGGEGAIPPSNGRFGQPGVIQIYENIGD
jgi:hypothetical protein